MKKITAVEKGLLLVGVMLPGTIFLLNRHFRLSDSVYGFLVGLGIGLELLALIRLAKRKKPLQSPN